MAPFDNQRRADTLCERGPRQLASDTESALSYNGPALPSSQGAGRKGQSAAGSVVAAVIENETLFLAGLGLASSRAIRERMASVAVAGGSTLFEEGDALYTSVAGAIGISLGDLSSGVVQRMARLPPPETFGEMALSTSAPRSATATALRDTHLSRLSRAPCEEDTVLHPRTLLYLVAKEAIGEDRMTSWTNPAS